VITKEKTGCQLLSSFFFHITLLNYGYFNRSSKQREVVKAIIFWTNEMEACQSHIGFLKIVAIPLQGMKEM